jgi:putative DNA primase/helicase
MDLEDFVSKLDGVRHMPSGVAARCPAHDDHTASLSINAGEHGGVVILCHAGCPTVNVVAALGLSLADLMGAPRLVEEYPYWTPDGSRVAYVVERWSPKDFRTRNLPPPAERILYSAPGIVWAREHGASLFYVEGERDANTLINLGIPATTNVGGAGPGKFLDIYIAQLAGVHVTIVADNDAPGREHARQIATAIKPSAASVALVRPPVGKDVTEFLAAGYQLDALVPLPETDDVGAYRADRIKVRKLGWAWAAYLPLGKITLVEGDPGGGKSLLTLDLAARLTTGAKLPDGSNGAGPWNVVLISAEDDPADTIVPRLMAAGARLDYVHLITHGLTPDLPFELAGGLPAVTRRVMEVGARAVILDPLSAFLGDSTDSHNDHSVRRALQPLKSMAENTGAAVICVRHLNKAPSGTKALYRSSGSIGFIGAARAAYVVAEDPNDADMRIFAPTKTNLTRKPAALRYEIDHTEDGIPFVRWKGSVELSAQMVLDGPERETSETHEESKSRRRLREAAAACLVDLLADGPKTWAELCELAREDGFSERTLVRARTDSNLVKIYGAQGQASTLWARPDRLPNAESDVPVSHFATSPQKGALRLTTHFAGEMEKREPQTLPSVTEPVTEVDRPSDLENAVLACDVCETTNGVSTFPDPWGCIRCVAHNPLTYGGK